MSYGEDEEALVGCACQSGTAPDTISGTATHLEFTNILLMDKIQEVVDLTMLQLNGTIPL